MGKKFDSKTILLITACAFLIAAFFYALGFVSAVFLPRFACDDDLTKTRPTPTESTTRTESTTTSSTTTKITTTTHIPADSLITITYAVENLLTKDDDVFRTTTLFNTTRKPFIEVMRDIEKVNPKFSFTTEENGHIVTQVRGVEANVADNLRWTFLRRTEAAPDCIIATNVDSYICSDGEYMVLSLQKADLSSELQTCTTFVKPVVLVLSSTVVGEEVISITYTVENTIMEDEDNFIAVAFLTTLAKPFYEIMGMVQKLDNRFRFTTQLSNGFGHYVTSVQDIAANHTAKVYWGFRRRNATSDCNMPVGVSMYVPFDGEHIVLSLTHYSYGLSSCESIRKNVPESP